MKWIKDFKSLFEGRTESGFRSKDNDVKKETFRTKIKNILKSKGFDVKQIGNDFEVIENDELVSQIMFRSDKMILKKSGDKFGKEFRYDQLGDLKKELSRI